MTKHFAPNPLQPINNATRLCAAVLHLSDDIDRLDHWELKRRLRELRALAETMRDTGVITGEAILLVLDDGNDYALATDDGPED